KKLVTQSNAFVSAFDQARNVRDRYPPILGELNNSDYRMQSCKRIRRNFWPGGGNCAKQRRFSGIRITDQPGIGDRSQLEQKISGLAFIAFGVLPSSAIARTFEMNIALAFG